MPDVSRFDVVIVGAGPAGILAATQAVSTTRSIALVDQGAFPGGQIWRRDVSDPGAAVPEWERALGEVTFIGGAAVVDAVTREGRHRLVVERQGIAMTLETGTLILATGARELFLPFPGWTLPNVLGVGGLQAMMKNGLDVRGKRVVIAGSGPLLVAVAATAVKKGAELVAVVEQASFTSMVRFGLTLPRHPITAVTALRYLQQIPGGVLQFGGWVSAAHGSGRVERVTVSNGADVAAIDCDILGSGFGLVPNTELARLLGCTVGERGILVDDEQRTSIAGIFAVGECTGVGGLPQAIAEGMNAGHAAVGEHLPWGALQRRNGARRWGELLDRIFALRPEVLALARPETIVCRCEDVRRRDIEDGWTARQAKLYSRAGMGPCQGRVCGAALARTLGWEQDTVRAPLHPATLSSLIGAS